MATRDSTTDEVNYLNSEPPTSLRDVIEAHASMRSATSNGDSDNSASAI
jgi:hypothetical protein